MAYRVFTLFFAGMEVPDGAETPWPLLLSGLLAPVLLIGGLVTAFSERVRDLWTRRSREHLLIVGSSPFAVALARHEVAERKVVVVDDGGDPQVLAALRRAGIRTVAAELIAPDLYARAAVGRAARIVVATGDDELSIDVADALAERGCDAQVYVRLADKVLAETVINEPSRCVGESGYVIACRPEVIAAQQLDLPESDGKRLLIVGDGLFTDALVLDALRKTRSRRRRGDGEGWRFVTVMAPDAVQVVEQLRTVFDGASGIPEVEAAPCKVEQGDLPSAVVRRIAAWNEPVHVVVVGDEIAGAEAIAAALVRFFGEIHWVGSRSRGIAGRISGATTDIDADSARLELLDRESIDSRLERSGTKLDQMKLLGTAAVMREFVHLRSGVRKVVEAISPGLSYRLEDASIHFATERVDLNAEVARSMIRIYAEDEDNTANAPRAQSHILSTPRTEVHAEATLMMWCEIIRRSADRDALVAAWNDPSLWSSKSTGIAGWIRRILALRIAFLSDDPDDRNDYLDPVADPPRHLHGPVAIFAGGAESLDRRKDADAVRTMLREMLGFAFDPSFDGVIVSGGTDSGLPGIVGDLAGELGIDAAGYAWMSAPRHPGYERYTEVGEASSLEQAITAWEDIARSGMDINDVRVFVCSGGAITRRELMIARALNVRLGWFPLSGDETDWDDELPGGAHGIVRLIDDRATVRAFLRPGRWPDEGEREQIGRAVHAAYVSGGTQAPGDVAMRSWDRQPQYLRDSNLAVADDLQVKLARVGLRLVSGAVTSGERVVPIDDLGTEELGLLAELEHGRFCSERLLAGWSDGSRDPIRLTTSVLVPWVDLDRKDRAKDRRTVLAALRAAIECGYTLVRIG